MVGAGWIIGNYELNPKPIGHGSFGTIYNARRLSDGLNSGSRIRVRHERFRPLNSFNERV